MFTIEVLIRDDMKWHRVEKVWETSDEAVQVVKNIRDYASDDAHNMYMSNFGDILYECVQVGSQTIRLWTKIVNSPSNIYNSEDFLDFRVAEVSSTIEINKKSWHYKLNSFFCPSGKMPRSLCSYFWYTLRNISICTVILIICLGLAHTIGVDALSKEFLAEFSPTVIFFFAIGTGITLIFASAGLTLLMFSFIHWYLKLCNYLKEKRYIKKTKLANEIIIKSKDDISTEIVKSFKNKVCPLITFKD